MQFRQWGNSGCWVVVGCPSSSPGSRPRRPPRNTPPTTTSVNATTSFAKIAGAIRSGHLRPDLVPEDAALRLTALMDGLQTQWLFDRSIDMAASLQHVVDDWLTPSGRVAYETVAVTA